MGTLVWESGGLPIIMDLLEEGCVDRQLLASVLRTSGDEGEDLLIKIIRYHKNYKLRLDGNDVIQLNAIPPGHICRYQGPISSLV